jgi:putative nucleotidyltransferase with HDIG domain
MQTRAEIAHGTQQTNSEAVMENPENEYIYQEAKDTALKFAEFLASEDQGFKAVLNLANTDQSVSHHGVTVATLANGLAKKLGNTDAKQLQLLTLGALLHDFEHFHSGLLINRPLSDMTEAEVKAYQQHPVLGAEKVADKKHFDKAVLNIILEHEEYIDGKGFPHGLTESKMDPLAVMVSSANALDRMIAFEGVDRNEATKKLMMEHVGRHPLNHIQLLGEILKQTR